ncbi:MAG: metal-dependent hydrolase [Chitinophagales bacterium]|nr:metal-dependent hydrolase [Chitinophagales bacterium]MCZ2393704.1 metal-dependent hydrolase [Chitinophagales bacterium]
MATSTKKATTNASVGQNEKETKKYDHEEVKVRRVNFSFDKETPRFYYKNNPFSTHFINTLHILFPTGERFFVNATLKHQKAIKDEKLKKQVRNFCGQEGIHSSMHERFWNILKSGGYNFQGYEDHIDFLLHKIVTKIEIEGTKINNIDLVATVCLEHFTALFGHAIFQHIDVTPEAAPEDIAELFQWHAAEEIEHKHVAFDVLNLVDKDAYIKKIALMPIVTAVLYFYLGIGTTILMYQDRKRLELTKLPKQFYEFATGLFTELHGDMVSDFFKFFKRDFHPSDVNDYYLAEEFFKDKAYA